MLIWPKCKCGEAAQQHSCNEIDKHGCKETECLNYDPIRPLTQELIDAHDTVCVFKVDPKVLKEKEKLVKDIKSVINRYETKNIKISNMIDTIEMILTKAMNTYWYEDEIGDIENHQDDAFNARKIEE